VTDQEKQDTILIQLKVFYIGMGPEQSLLLTSLIPSDFILILKSVSNRLECNPPERLSTFFNYRMSKVFKDNGITQSDIIRLIREYIVLKEISR
jgi:hypothetical protein